MSWVGRLFLLICLLAMPLTARGGLSACNSWYVVSSDNSRRFVMLSENIQLDNSVPIAVAGARVFYIKDMFSASGVYEAKTHKLIWMTPWYAHQGELLWTDDFQHVARLGRLAYHGGAAVTFYDRGMPVRSYSVASLLTVMRSEYFLPFETWNWHFRWYENFEFGESRDRVHLTTVRRRFRSGLSSIDIGVREDYQFDLATGQIVSRDVSGRWLLPVYGLVAVAVCAILGVLCRRVWRKLQRRKRYHGFEVVARV